MRTASAMPVLIAAARDLTPVAFVASAWRTIDDVAFEEAVRWPVIGTAAAAALGFAIATAASRALEDDETRQRSTSWARLRLAGALAGAVWLCPAAGLAAAVAAGAALLLARRAAGGYSRAAGSDRLVRAGRVQAFRAAFDRPLSFLAGGAAALFEQQQAQSVVQEDRLAQTRLRAALRFDLLREIAVAAIVGSLSAGVLYLLPGFFAGTTSDPGRSFALFLTMFAVVRAFKAILAAFVQ